MERPKNSVLDGSFWDLIRDFIDHGGRLCTRVDLVVAGVCAVVGGFVAWLLRSSPTSLQTIAQGTMTISGAALGITIAAMAIAASLMSSRALSVIKASGNFPAVFMPYWLVGLAWMFTAAMGFAWFLWEAIPVYAVAVGCVLSAIDVGLLGFSFSVTGSLFRSILRLMDVAAELNDGRDG